MGWLDASFEIQSEVGSKENVLLKNELQRIRKPVFRTEKKEEFASQGLRIGGCCVEEDSASLYLQPLFTALLVSVQIRDAEPDAVVREVISRV